MTSFNLFLYVVMCSMFCVESKRILAVFPTPSISHQVVFRPLTQELAKRGHEVIVLTPDPAFPKGETPTNLTEIDVHDLSYNAWKEFVDASSGKKDDITTQMKVALDLFTKIFEQQMLSKEFQQILKDKRKFDLLLIEACVPIAMSLSHVFKVPVILTSSLGAVFDNYKVIGAPSHPILYPLATQQRIYNMTIWEKAREIYYFYKMEKLLRDHEEDSKAVLERLFGPEVPPLSKLHNNVDMLFVNVNPIFEGNYPVPPTVVYMGGLHQKPLKELPHDLKSYLDSSKHGIIYMSFGTNTKPSNLPAEKIQMFVNVFSRLPYDVLWKWDKDDLPGKTRNIRIGKWFPQSDLLRHPKIKLFITQGGLQSTDEAITSGVPLIGIPMLGDQWFNTEKYVHHKIGLKLDIESITEEELKKAIDEVIGNDSYKKNIKKLGQLMKDQPQGPLERAIWWTEYVLRHGGARHLRSPAANISWAQYLELDLVLALLGIVVTSVIVLVALIYTLSKLLFSSGKKQKLS